jgi:hypothetical protein
MSTESRIASARTRIHARLRPEGELRPLQRRLPVRARPAVPRRRPVRLENRDPGTRRGKRREDVEGWSAAGGAGEGIPGSGGSVPAVYDNNEAAETSAESSDAPFHTPLFGVGLVVLGLVTRFCWFRRCHLTPLSWCVRWCVNPIGCGREARASRLRTPRQPPPQWTHGPSKTSPFRQKATAKRSDASSANHCLPRPALRAARCVVTPAKASKRVYWANEH